MWKKFKLWGLGVLSLVVFDSCRLISRINHTFSKKVVSSYSDREIENLLLAAQSYQGVTYRLGGIDEKGMDCSGLLFRIYSDENYIIPRVTSQQAEFGLPISLDAIQKGDWLFFRTNGSENTNHVGLVTKVQGSRDVSFIHASTSKGVREDNLFSNYWFNVFEKVIRPYKNNSN